MALKFRDVKRGDELLIIRLWERCELTRPWNNPTLDFRRKMDDFLGAFWLVENNGQIIASVMVGYDGHRGSLNYLAVDPDFQGNGIGRKLVAEAEGFLRKKGCAKLNVAVREDNTAATDFYTALAYETDPVVTRSKRLIHDD